MAFRNFSTRSRLRRRSTIRRPRYPNTDARRTKSEDEPITDAVNENVPLAVVEAVRSAGHDVAWIRTDAPGSKDDEFSLARYRIDEFSSPSTRTLAGSSSAAAPAQAAGSSSFACR